VLSPSDLTGTRDKLLLLLGALALSCSPLSAQTRDRSEDVVRIRTRVVFLDVLVTDRRTNTPVTDLKSDDFEVFDNDRLRRHTYFSRNGERPDRPLALVLILAPIDERAGKSLQNPALLKSIASALTKLPREDEVALMFSRWGGLVPPQTLVAFTRDRAQIVEALVRLQSFIQPQPASSKPPGESRKALEEPLLAMVSERPDSQVAVIMATDSVYQMTRLERDEIATRLLKRNVTFNALLTGTDKFFSLAYPLLKPASDTLGVSLYGVPGYLARQTGGEEVRVRRAEDYGAALEQLIGDLSARYSLGFTLDEGEPDDGLIHRLKVKVTARDGQGKKRQLKVTTRQGYYALKREDE
jgi:VWFA-related protein